MNKINRSVIFYWFLLAIVISLMNACATSPNFDTAGVDINVTPQRATYEFDVLQGSSVLWGGVIINSTNLKDATQIEILAYPLSSNQRPDREKQPLGRFLAERTGYLETTDYSQGKAITVIGTLDEKRSGRVGEAEYTYPVVKIKQLHLWSGASGSQVQFGFGLMIHN